jgi:hypothetical protein
MATKIQNLAQQAVSIYRKQGWEAFVGFCEENPQITRRALEHAGMVPPARAGHDRRITRLFSGTAARAAVPLEQPPLLSSKLHI